jgi:type 1 glutamine amidotransferase
MSRFIPITTLLILALCSATPQTSRLRILFIVGGQYHDYDALPRKLAQNLQKKLTGAIAVDFTISKDLSLLRRDELSKYDALMMNVCEQTPLTAEEKDGLQDRVRNGMPTVSLHCTFWSFQDWPEFRKILGAFVPGHQHFGTFCLETTRADSPILRGVPSRFELTDEPYIVNERDASMDVLVQTCKSLEGRSGPEPEVWTKKYGTGRIFAMTFGHDVRAQENPTYISLLANGLVWALGPAK